MVVDFGQSSQLMMQYANQLKQERLKKEEEGKKSQFNLGNLIGGIIASVFTGNPTPLLLAAGGEGARAATGGDSATAQTIASTIGGYLPSEKSAPTTGQKSGGISQYFKDMAGKMGSMPQTTAEKQVETLGLKPYQYTSPGGVTYKNNETDPMSLMLMSQLGIGQQNNIPDMIKKLQDAGATPQEIILALMK